MWIRGAGLGTGTKETYVSAGMEAKGLVDTGIRQPATGGRGGYSLPAVPYMKSFAASQYNSMLGFKL